MTSTEQRRKPGESTSTNDLILAMRMKGKAIETIATEFGESAWYVRSVLRLQMTEDERDAAANLCKELASQTGAATQKRRRLYRQMMGDVEFHDHTDVRVRVPLPKSLGVYVDRELLARLKDRADREGIKLSDLVFPVFHDHLELATEGIDMALKRLLT